MAKIRRALSRLHRCEFNGVMAMSRKIMSVSHLFRRSVSPLWFTVYPMCAAVPQLFMVPALRQAILETKMPRRKLEDYPRELVGRRVLLQWEAGGSIEAFVAGYDERTGTCFHFVALPHHFLLDDIACLSFVGSGSGGCGLLVVMV